MPLRTHAHWFEVTLACPDPGSLAGFYAALLGWPIFASDPDGAVVAPSQTQGYSLSFERDEHFVAPVWPSRAGEPVLQSHLDLEVDDLAEAEKYAVQVGARLHEHQPQDDVRVMLDPVGHLFCLYTDPRD